MQESVSQRAAPEGEPQIGPARRALLRRLIDVVALPSSRLPSQDRSMASDILLEVLFAANEDELILCSRRLADKKEAPRRLLRFLACAPISVASHVLEHNDGLDDSDLCQIAASGTIDHRACIAQRNPVGTLVAEKLISFGELRVLKHLLQNSQAVLSDACVDALVTESRDRSELCGLLMDRRELTPAHAMAMFWWSDRETRLAILQRQAADRLELISSCADVFALAAEERWADPVARKSLQLIERRQRNRSAVGKSPYDSLEHAIESAARLGLSPQLAQEIGYLAGVKPVTIAKILSDPGGEGIAIICKATGLKLPYIRQLWQALRRPLHTETGEPDPLLSHVEYIYQIMSVAKAQTTLRYWNWSLSSAFSPTGPVESSPHQQIGDEEFSAASRTARLVFGG